MRINDLLLLESEMLLESYRDFRKAWYELLDSPTVSDGNRRAASKTPDQLESLLKDNQKRAALRASEEAGKVIKQLEIHNSLDITSWLARLNASARSGRPPETLVHVFRHAVDIIDNAVKSEINNRNPKYTTIKKTPEYIIFDVENFSGAQKLRNQVKSTWCIGASDGHFKHYGEESGRSTVIVFFLKKKEGMVFHVDQSGGGLITSHDNQREWTVNGGSFRSSRGYSTLVEELGQYLDQDEMVDFVKATGMRIKEELLRAKYKPINPDILRDFIDDLEGGRYSRLYTESMVRWELIRHARAISKRVFSSGNPIAIIRDVVEMLTNMATWRRNVSKRPEESIISEAPDVIVCTLAIVEYLDAIQIHATINGSLSASAMKIKGDLRRALNDSGTLKDVNTYTSTFDTVWPRLRTLIHDMNILLK